MANLKKRAIDYNEQNNKSTMILEFLLFIKQHIGRFIRFFVPYRFRNYSNIQGFHGDPFLRYLVFKSSELLDITACVETGSFKGDTALFLAKVFPSVFRYSIELNNEYYRESSWRLRSYKKSKIIKGSSPNVIRKLIDSSKLGKLPLFFLDAHWYKYWPLQDELKEVSKLDKAVIIIDDFQVEGRPEYGFDSYGHGDESIPNNFDFISKYLTAKKYYFLLPRYQSEEAFPEDKSALRGYVLIFQNLNEEDWLRITNLEIVKTRYTIGELPR